MSDEHKSSPCMWVAGLLLLVGNCRIHRGTFWTTMYISGVNLNTPRIPNWSIRRRSGLWNVALAIARALHGICNATS